MIMTVEDDEKGSPFCNTVGVRSIDPFPEEKYIQQFQEIPQKMFLELLEYKIALKLSCVSESLQKCLPKFT